jgi:hypothetical protein
MTEDDISYARSAATHCADYLHLAFFVDDSREHWIRQAHGRLAALADLMDYTITPKSDDVTRLNQTIEAAGMGGNGFAGAEYAAHVLTVAMRNGGS